MKKSAFTASLIVSALIVTLSLLTPVATGAAASPQDLDRILAVVNDDVITLTELESRVHEVKKQLALEKITLPPEAVLQKQVLDRLILEQLQLQRAQQAGIRVTDADVERALETIASRNRLTLAEFQKKLREEGLSPEAHRAQVKTQVTIQQLLEREIFNRVAVTESEINAFLETQENRAAVNLEYKLSHILISLPDGASPETIAATRERAAGVHKKITQGTDFAQLAIAHSQSAEALAGGQLGWKKAGQLPELFLNALKDLKTGGVSDVLRSPNGFHILKLTDKRGGEDGVAVTQTRARHILVKPSEILASEEAKNKLLALRERLSQGDDFATIARAHSEDTGSAALGGDLGWTNPGETVPEFERVMNALKPGELSTPFQSRFGWHLIEVLGRREKDVSSERLRSQARSQIQARKADERLEQWARQLRDEAYVEIRLDDVN
jgi:peptidyl-prolyl cis-trans isomerase SurA